MTVLFHLMSHFFLRPSLHYPPSPWTCILSGDLKYITLLAMSLPLIVSPVITSLHRCDVMCPSTGVAVDCPAPPLGLVGVLRFARFELAGVPLHLPAKLFYHTSTIFLKGFRSSFKNPCTGERISEETPAIRKPEIST